MLEGKEKNDFPFFVTYVNFDGPLLQVMGYIDKTYIVQVEEKLASVFNQLDNLQTKVANLMSNTLCCIKFQEKRYYRARILSPVNNKGFVTVQLVDYGNIESVPIQNIRFLTNFQDNDIAQLPVLLKIFVLANIGPKDKEIIQCDYIRSILIGKDVVVKYLGQFEGRHLIQLKLDGFDFATSLIEKNVAKYVTIDTMFSTYNLSLQKSNMPQPLSPRVNTSFNESFMEYPPPSLLSNIKQIYPRSESDKIDALQPTVFKCRVLDIGKDYDVHVSYIEDGPRKFSVQLTESRELLALLMQDINKCPRNPLSEPPLPGSVCLARYTYDDVYCRAVVMMVSESKCKVYFVDFGHTESLPYSDIFQLPVKYIEPRVLAIRMTLTGIKNWNITNEVKEFFKNFVKDRCLKLRVCEPEGPPLIQYGILFDKDRDIKDIFLEHFPKLQRSKRYEEATKLHLFQEVLVNVTYVQSCNNFFVQLNQDVGALDNLMQYIRDKAGSFRHLDANQFTVGTPCIALYDVDKQWYRAQITGINKDLAKVLYIDYGNEESVRLDTLKAIDDYSLSALRCQAIKCTLKGFQGQAVSQDYITKFENLAMEKSLIMSVDQVLTNSYIVDLQDPETRQSIILQLKAEVEPELLENHFSQNNRNIDHRRQQDVDWKARSKPEVAYQKPYNKNEEEMTADRKHWKDNDNERKYDKTKKTLNVNVLEQHGPVNSGRSFKENQDDRFTRREAYSPNEYDAENTFRSGKDFRSTKPANDKEIYCNNTRQKFAQNEPKWRNDKFMEEDNNQSSLKTKQFGEPSNFSNTYNPRQEQRDPNRYNEPKSEESFLTIKSLTIKVPSTQDCMVSYIKNPSEFYLMLLGEEEKKLEDLMQKINETYTTNSKTLAKSKTKEGTFCIAPYSQDGRWYRAMIKTVNGPDAVIYFIDYGNEETVKLDQLKEITAEMTKCPIQAIPCQMFNVQKKSDWGEALINTFIDMTHYSVLETKFVCYKDNVYHVLLRQKSNEPDHTCNQSDQPYINQIFAPGIDFRAEKISTHETQSQKEKELKKGTVVVSPSQKYESIKIDIGSPVNVIVTWFKHPNNFYCQAVNPKYVAMMKQIQKFYANSRPITTPLKVNDPVIAVFDEDNAFYRAKVIELNVMKGHRVQYVDFGNSAIVKQKQIYPIDEQFLQLPKIAFECSLKGILPPSGNDWKSVNLIKVERHFDHNELECIVHDIIDEKYQVSLHVNGTDVADTLIKEGLAISSEIPSVQDESINNITENVNEDVSIATPAKGIESLQFDITLLVNQTLMAIVSNVVATNKFYIQLPSAEICQTYIAEFMASTDAEVLPLLPRHEVCPLTGCLIFLDGLWRRAVVLNSCLNTMQIDVKLIDTGACHSIQMDRLLALPEGLTCMQNQAIECCLKNTSPSSEQNKKLKKLIENKPVIVQVLELDTHNDSLLVDLYDAKGVKIDVEKDSSFEKICPICPLPILQRSENVNLSVIDEDGLWLQKMSDIDPAITLLNELAIFYSNDALPITPQVGSLCAALSEDGNWFRAKIIEFNDNDVCVHYIDYGNTENLPVSSVKVLEPQFYVPHAFAIKLPLVSLQSSPKPISHTFLQELDIINGKFTATFYNTNGQWSVELESNGEKLSDRAKALCPEQPKETTTEEETLNADFEKSNVTRDETLKAGKQYKMCVSHVDNPTQFWLQKSSSIDLLIDFQFNLQKVIPSAPEIKGIPEVKTICLAKYSIDEFWYRAEVLDADSEITTVRFIDYGNTDVIDNVRVPIRELPSEQNITAVPPFAHLCQLDLSPMENDIDWSQEACSYFGEFAAVGLELEVIIKETPTQGPIKVELNYENIVIGDELIKKGFAQQGLKAMCGCSSSDTNLETNTDLALYDENSAFFSDCIGVNNFHLQEIKHQKDLTTICDRLLMGDLEEKAQNIKVGEMYIAKFEDNLWYRAKVLEKIEDGFKVLFVDYGNTFTTTDLRVIPSDVAAYPIMVRKCKLYYDGTWPKGADEIFFDLGDEGRTTFILTVVDQLDDISVVELKLNGEDVVDIILRECAKQEKEDTRANHVESDITLEDTTLNKERLPPVGEETFPDVLVSHVESLNQFYIRMKNDDAVLNKLNTELLNSDKYLPLKNPKIGDICAALWNNKWCRAKILQIEGSKTKVFFIDYGHSDVINDGLKSLPENIVNHRPLTIRCALKLPKGIERWSDKANEKFIELTDGGKTVFQFEIIKKGDTKVVELRLNEKDIVDILAPLCESSLPISDNEKDKTLSVISEDELENESIDSEFSVRKSSSALATSDNAGQMINLEASKEDNLNECADASKTDESDTLAD